MHQWTVDRHLVRTCVEAAKLTTTVPRPDLLLIGALLHDIGKGRDADHSELGAKISAQVAARLGLDAADAATVSAMVRHHLLLPHTATRRDISEPTVARVVKTLDSDIVLVELLHALTQADSLATGPGVWTDWKARLHAELVTGCEEVLRGKGFTAPEPMDSEQRELVAQAVASGNGEVRISTHGKVVTVLLAVAGPRGAAGSGGRCAGAELDGGALGDPAWPRRRARRVVHGVTEVRLVAGGDAAARAVRPRGQPAPCR